VRYWNGPVGPGVRALNSLLLITVSVGSEHGATRQHFQIKHLVLKMDPNDY